MLCSNDMALITSIYNYTLHFLYRGRLFLETCRFYLIFPCVTAVFTTNIYFIFVNTNINRSILLNVGSPHSKDRHHEAQSFKAKEQSGLV